MLTDAAVDESPVVSAKVSMSETETKHNSVRSRGGIWSLADTAISDCAPIQTATVASSQFGSTTFIPTDYH